MFLEIACVSRCQWHISGAVKDVHFGESWSTFYVWWPLMTATRETNFPVTLINTIIPLQHFYIKQHKQSKLQPNQSELMEPPGPEEDGLQLLWTVRLAPRRSRSSCSVSVTVAFLGSYPVSYLLTFDVCVSLPGVKGDAFKNIKTICRHNMVFDLWVDGFYRLLGPEITIHAWEKPFCHPAVVQMHPKGSKTFIHFPV